jgi:hypothetical protein
MPLKFFERTFSKNTPVYSSYKPLTKLLRRLSVNYGIKMKHIKFKRDNISIEHENKKIDIETTIYFYVTDEECIAKIRKRKIDNLVRDI